ncbi:hypothetical protein Afe04nite_02020 [Asanoa ferruginea]|nr:hypothetical protein Afe04nite_02020 [Asanoa ferruginea]
MRVRVPPTPQIPAQILSAARPGSGWGFVIPIPGATPGDPTVVGAVRGMRDGSPNVTVGADVADRGQFNRLPGRLVADPNGADQEDGAGDGRHHA